MTINTANDLNLIAAEASVTHNMFIKATLDDYTTQTREVYTAVDIVITQAGCDCSALAWTTPAASIDITGTSIFGGLAAEDRVLVKPDQVTTA